MRLTLKRSLGMSAAALLASSATLVCCVLPAVMVSLGAGAVLVGLVAAVPQLVWLSAHKGWVFGIAGCMLLVSGFVRNRAAALPCPADPTAARMCLRLRSLTSGLFWIAVAAYVIGAGFVLVTSLVSD